MQPEDLTRRSALVLTAGTVIIGQAAVFGAESEGNTRMEKVVGIGGFFFRAKDPKKLAQWYADNLGVTMAPQDYDSKAWRQEAGTTVFAPFQHDTNYFGDMRLQWMINFRVRNLDKMVAQLRSRGSTVEVDTEVYPNGRFAKVNDPEGNPIQLWEPGGKDPG
jgi:predicted enzyme related to lactoylglutathione lyase